MKLALPSFWRELLSVCHLVGHAMAALSIAVCLCLYLRLGLC